MVIRLLLWKMLLLVLVLVLLMILLRWLMVVWLLLCIRGKRPGKELILNRRLLGVDLERRRSRAGRRRVAIGHVLGHLVDRIGGNGRINVHDGGTGCCWLLAGGCFDSLDKPCSGG